MTKLLEQAVQAVRDLPPAAQDDIAMIMLQLVSDEEPAPVPLSPAERRAIEISKAAAARGEFASEARIKALWAKYDL